MNRITATGRALRQCIERSMRAKDNRGSAVAERVCLRALGDTPINRNCAAAARRIGEWLRSVQP